MKTLIWLCFTFVFARIADTTHNETYMILSLIGFVFCMVATIKNLLEGK